MFEPGGIGFFIGIEVQKRRLGSMGALASTINIIVLDNPMTFHFSQFLDSALGKLSAVCWRLSSSCWCVINPKIEPVACCLISLFRCGLGNDD
ncbi:fusaric acid resistance protein FusB/ fusaricacid resistance protein FusC [Salmonella enterica subsp. enterica]|uniref:Fusaric acid resistance protein FusB/ fusaricacid resistance protein FusC n=1 Tax=Salmonella enterica I TaxID=59201 RepID=A0A379WL58_SALET|nr:fusaric acid resistance protein FusB/ fusaricacid resistance protein FusC [Salmonella enterica subsp. enterica]